MKFQFSLKELLIMCFVFSLSIPMCLGTLGSVTEKSNQLKCKANLDYMGKAIKLYVLNYGQNKYYPNTSGGGFIARLYQVGLVDTKYYICPSTEDKTKGEVLKNLIKEDSNDINATSYSGRKNKKQGQYPGIFRPFRECHFDITPIAADDMQNGMNHPDNSFNVLFLAGFADHIQQIDEIMDEQDIEEILDPVTN